MMPLRRKHQKRQQKSYERLNDYVPRWFHWHEQHMLTVDSNFTKARPSHMFFNDTDIQQGTHMDKISRTKDRMKAQQNRCRLIIVAPPLQKGEFETLKVRRKPNHGRSWTRR